MLKRVVISGGDGFIGSHLSKYLVQRGFEVYAIILPKSKTRCRIEGISGIHIIEAYLDKYEEIASKLPMKPEAFVHLAWGGVEPEKRKLIDEQKKNLDLTLFSVELAKLVEAQKYVFPGSTLEYSHSGRIINREALPSPQDVYGVTKIAARYYSEVLCKQYGIPHVYAVISSVYASDRIDNNVINYTITKLLHNEKPALTKLEQLWDYVYIDDVMNALTLIIEKGKDCGFYVVGHGDNCPLINYILAIRDIINPELQLGIGDIPYENNKIPMACVDLSEISKDTGYVPQTSYEEGIRIVIEKIREREGMI